MSVAPPGRQRDQEFLQDSAACLKAKFSSNLLFWKFKLTTKFDKFYPKITNKLLSLRQQFLTLDTGLWKECKNNDKKLNCYLSMSNLKEKTHTPVLTVACVNTKFRSKGSQERHSLHTLAAAERQLLTQFWCWGCHWRGECVWQWASHSRAQPPAAAPPAPRCESGGGRRRWLLCNAFVEETLKTLTNNKVLVVTKQGKAHTKKMTRKN